MGGLPDFHLDDGTVFDKERIFPYAYRHSFAQRHADAGVPIDVLAELLDHDSYECTRCYYRVKEVRLREAVDKVTRMQFDRHGKGVWGAVTTLLEAERTRRAVGSVIVPFGTCSEPSNVAAGGGRCPLRFRCVGCDHFSTDVSYLPELRAYLDDLLRNRERLRSMAEADDWARVEAAPSDEAIRRVRCLIGRVTEEVDQLTEDERTEIHQAAAMVRKTRLGFLGMPCIRQPQPDLRPHLPLPPPGPPGPGSCPGRRARHRRRRPRARRQPGLPAGRSGRSRRPQRPPRGPGPPPGEPPEPGPGRTGLARVRPRRTRRHRTAQGQDHPAGTAGHRPGTEAPGPGR